MTLVDAVAAHLDRQAIPHCLIGAGALAAHGVSRSTLDQDLLVTDGAVLNPGFWSAVVPGATLRGATLDVRRGDADDPLLGVVRIRADHERDVDVIVGRQGWQKAVIARAQRGVMGNIPVSRASDLVLLKLYAGGSQDRWDIEQLLALDAAGTVASEVEDHLDMLPPSARLLWRTLRPKS